MTEPRSLAMDLAELLSRHGVTGIRCVYNTAHLETPSGPLSLTARMDRGRLVVVVGEETASGHRPARRWQRLEECEECGGSGTDGPEVCCGCLGSGRG